MAEEKKETAAEKKARIAEEKKAAREAKKAEKEKAKAEAKANKKPGVIASILITIKEAKKPVSQAQILENLVKLFPDREEASMSKTVKAQLGGKKSPTRMEKEKGVEFKVTPIEDSKDKTYEFVGEKDWK